MRFPFTPTTDLQHKWGGKIMLVHGIKHQAVTPKDGRSLDGWWFDCDVLWDDTGKVSRGPVESFKLCAEDGGRNPDIRALDAAMMDYLKANARHCGERTKHEGWYFNERRAKAAV
jgi:hypothetical protein